ncbi:MAG TPA: tail fiber domain-containing protein [Chitinophagaceae bacterium]
MKKIIITTIIATAFFGFTSMAQTGQWKLAGNNLTGTEKLGSTNNQDVRFISNNVINGVLTKTGLWGIGTSAPLSKLHVRNGSSGISPFFQSAITAESSTNTYMSLLSPSVSETGILFGNNSGNTSGGIIYNSSFAGGTPNALQFRTNGNTPRMVLTGAGNVGIGTTTPKASLHIFRGSAGGIAPNIESPIVAEANGNSFINLLTPVANVSGILFGNNINAVDGGIVYGGTSHKMEFRTGTFFGAGNITRMVLTNEGHLGIGTTSPTTNLVVAHVNEGPLTGLQGLAISNASTSVTNSWGFYTAGNGNLELSRNKGFSGGGTLGVFNASSGSYTSLSDARMKKNIEHAPDVLEKILQLDVKKYHFLKNKQDDKKYYGMIAQEVEKIFPEVVFKNKLDGTNDEYYTMDYSAFGVLAVKAIQELVKTNDSLRSEIKNLKSEMSEIKAMLKSNSGSTSSEAKINTLLTDASLEQNAPNPFTNSTTIHYSLPQKFTRAQIIITDKSGKTIKQINISGAGKGIVNVDASTLSSGTYQYSLMVNGKLISTRQMVLIK